MGKSTLCGQNLDSSVSRPSNREVNFSYMMHLSEMGALSEMLVYYQ